MKKIKLTREYYINYPYSLLKKINSSDFKGASLEFEKWNKSGGVVLSGLAKRSLKEKALFIS